VSVVRVLRGARAQYIPATGLQLVSTSVEAMLDSITSASPEGFEDAVTFIHESIHHLQVLSSSYLWLDSLLRVRAGTAVLFARSEEERRRATLQLRRSSAAFHHRAYGVSVADLCEGVAVLESFRATASSACLDDYLRFRDHHFPGKGNSIYRRAFDLLAHETSAEVAYDLLPPLTWLALQGDIPGRSFVRLLASADVRSGALVGRSPRDLLDLSGTEAPLADRDLLEQLDPSLRHPTLYPVLLRLHDEVGGDRLLDVFAHPHRAVGPEFFPPLVFGSHRLGQVRNAAYGAARESQELRLAIPVLTAYLFAAEQLVDRRDAHLPCPHTNCPNHASGLCTGWFTPPPEPDLCGFRARVRAASGGKELHEIAAAFSDLALDGDAALLSGDSDLAMLFPDAEEVELDPRVADLAERFDHAFDLDPEDNDALAILVCPDCRSLWQEWVSHRRLAAGFAIRCRCGALMEGGRDRGTVIRMDDPAPAPFDSGSGPS
jgi:hypothetical protein